IVEGLPFLRARPRERVEQAHEPPALVEGIHLEADAILPTSVVNPAPAPREANASPEDALAHPAVRVEGLAVLNGGLLVAVPPVVMTAAPRSAHRAPSFPPAIIPKSSAKYATRGHAPTRPAHAVLSPGNSGCCPACAASRAAIRCSNTTNSRTRNTESRTARAAPSRTRSSSLFSSPSRVSAALPANLVSLPAA